MTEHNPTYDERIHEMLAREDVAFNAWLEARRDRLAKAISVAPDEGVRELLRSAFQSGVRHGRSDVYREFEGSRDKEYVSRLARQPLFWLGILALAIAIWKSAGG